MSLPNSIAPFEPALRESFSRHWEEIQTSLRNSGAKLDEEQVFKVFCEALASGDFVKHVVAGSGAQGFTYQPYREASELREKYHELLYAVARKFPDETRHETALRYILQSEERPHSEPPCEAS